MRLQKFAVPMAIYLLGEKENLNKMFEINNGIEYYISRWLKEGWIKSPRIICNDWLRILIGQSQQWTLLSRFQTCKTFWTTINFCILTYLYPKTFLSKFRPATEKFRFTPLIYSFGFRFTLPKAQRTRGLSSDYQSNFFRSCRHKFSNKLWLDFIFIISTKQQLQNLNQYQHFD